MASPAVQLQIKDKYIILGNGIVEVTLSNPAGLVTGIQYNGIENLLDIQSAENRRGYWDLVWSESGSKGTTGKFDVFEGTNLNIVIENDDQVEISFTRKWNSQKDQVPLNLDKRFIMLRNTSGFYSYAIYEHLADWPAFNLPQTRLVFKLAKEKFRYMAVADNRQRFMPLPEDRLPSRSKELDFPEAVLLVNPVEPEFKGEVDDKYQYSCENKDLQVHGWISSDPPVGFWQITPSNEFRSGGPIKQNLTSHVGPYSLAMFLSAHYAGDEMVLKLNPGEAWKKVFGPVFFYLNTVENSDKALLLWNDAQKQAETEISSWPYTFPASEDCPGPDERGTVHGTLKVLDRFLSNDLIPANRAYVGMAPRGETGSWQTESKGYQFWTQTDENGNFCINGVRSGEYNLYAWVPGFIGDYRNEKPLTIMSGCNIRMGELIYEPPRYGPTLWEIGFPDRTAREFYIPDPNPMYINKLYVNHPDRFRQYGLWERYAELYPNEDLVYTIGESDYKEDWFFAHVNRKIADKEYKEATWRIKFNMPDVNQTGNYVMRLALATANAADLQVRVNNNQADPPTFRTGTIGHDNTIARHGIHGLYRLFRVVISGSQLIPGQNTIFLTQSNKTNPVQGVMYDYIRLEGPPESAL